MRAAAVASVALLFACAALLAMAAPAQALTAEFRDVPASHDGSSVFTLRLAFSEAVFDGSESFDKNQAIKNALQVTGGTIRGRRRVDPGAYDRWIFRIRPSGTGSVTVGLPATTGACSEAGAICTPGGTALSNAPSATVPGPAAIAQVSISAGSSPVNEGTSPSFTLTRTGSLTSALTVNVNVSENGAMLKGTPASTVTIDANSATAELSAETEDDEAVESTSVVTASLSSGSGYSIDSGAPSAAVTVEDDDAAPVITSTGPLPADENGTAIATLTATDDDTSASGLSWSVTGGADQNRFTLSTGGVLAFAAAKDFEAPDDADEDGDYEVTVRVTDGANPVEATLTVSLTDVDEVAPTLESANVIGDTLTLAFSEFLDGNSVPGSSAFTVAVDGTTRSVDAVAAQFDDVTLTLASAVAAGETVTVGYTAPTGSNASPLKDLAGNAVAGFSDEAVTNDTGTVARVGIYSLSPDWGEGANTNFRVYLVRFGDTSEALTVNVSVTETGSMLVDTPPSSFTFAAGSDEIKLEDVRSSLIEDDLIDEPDSEVTITILAGTGYRTSETLWGGPSLTFTVRDNDTSPVITTASPVLVKENRRAITKLTANRTWYALLESGNSVSWSLVGGADEDQVTLSTGGDLAFKTAKDFEAPDDADSDGDYEIEVRVTDAAGNSTDGTLTVRLTDVSSTASGQPAISSTAPQVGNVLTAARGTIDDDDGVPATLAYQWVQVDGSSESDIAGATSGTYTLGTADVGKQVRVKVSFTDDGGNAEGPLASDPYPSTGSVVAAKRACPSDADWCAEMTLWADTDASLWYGPSIFSAAFAYSSADGRGSLSDDSVSHRGIDYTVTVISRSLLVLSADSYRQDGMRIGVSGGELPDGTVFTVGGATLTVGADSDEPRLEEVWDVTGLSLPLWFQGQKVTVSLKFPANSPPAGLPKISGTTEVGETLTASKDEITDDDGLTNATFAWQWITSDGSSDTEISGATDSTYTLTSAEIGKTIKVRVTFTDDLGVASTLVSAATETVLTANASPTGLPTISGTVRVGETLTASKDDIADDNGLTDATFAWRWFSKEVQDGDPIGWDPIGTGETYTLTSAELGKEVRVVVTFTDDEGHPERLISDATETVGTANNDPTGLPTIAGTARVGETLTASASAVADADGLSNAAFAWQWVANDGTSDLEIADATEETYTLTAAEAGKTIKVRVTFTDDQGKEEMLVSEATAQVAAALPVVSITAISSPVTEGGAASFTLSRTGDAAAELTVSVAVAEVGSVLSGTPASTVTLTAGDAEATLGVATDDDSTAEADGRVTATISVGTGYEVDVDAASAGIDVYDNDEAASTAVETLWTSTMTVQDVGGALLGYVFGDGLSPNGWSEDGSQFRVNSLHYFAQYNELSFTLSAGLSDPEQLTLHLDDLQAQLGGVSGEKYFYWTVDHPGWQAGQTVAVKLTRADPDAAVDAGPGISVADAQVQEAEGAVLAFVVTLDASQTSAVSVRYATVDDTATAGDDYVSVSGALRFAPGETAKTVSVPVLNDDHDDDGETLTLTLSHPFGAEIADGTATGTIRNTDPMPQAWMARFGRTVADQVINAVKARMEAPRVPETELSLAGQRLGGPSAPGGPVLTADVLAAGAERSPAAWFGDGDDPEWLQGPALQTTTPRDLLLGSSFSFTGGTERSGTYALWGRGAVTRFDGREGGLSMDGEVTSGMLGVDWSRDALTAGLVVSHSLGEGGYRGEAGDGAVSSSLTGLYPWGRYALSERLSLWGVAGYGEGTLTLTPEGQAPIRTDLDLMMAAAGLRGELVRAPESGGFELAVTSDAMGVQTSTASAEGLAAAEAEVTRLRLGLEGSRPFSFEGGASLTPSVEIGARHDGGDAETEFGVDLGGGLAWSDPRRGLSAELRGRGLLNHDADGFRERGFSGSLSFDPTPGTDRGLALSLSQTVGAQASGGVDALLGRGTLAGLAVDDDGQGGLAQRRFDLKLGYGLPAIGDRFTSTPELGFGKSREHRDYRLGWRLNLAQAGASALEFRLEAARREAVSGHVAEPEHVAGFQFTARR